MLLFCQILVVTNIIHPQKNSFFLTTNILKLSYKNKKPIQHSAQNKRPSKKANRTKQKYLKNEGVSLSKILNEFSIIKKKKLHRQTYKTKTTKPKQFKKKSV